MAEKVIIYPRDEGGIAIMWPAAQYPIEEVAKKDVPIGKPYLIINSSDLPPNPGFREAWTADFTDADGYGQGFSQWFKDNVISPYGGEIPVNQVSEKDKPWPKV